MSYCLSKRPDEKIDFHEDDRIDSQSGYRKCIQCGRCTASCPAAFIYDDFSPREVMRKLKIGDLKSLINGPEIWRCGQCLSCAARCPRDCSPAAAIQTLRIEALKTNPAIDHLRLIQLEVMYNVNMTGQTILPSTLTLPEDLIGERTRRRCSNNNELRKEIGYRKDDSRCVPIPDKDLTEIKILLRLCDFSWR